MQAYNTYTFDYYPFGMVMPGRSYSTTAYKYGFNGKEKDDEVSGSGNQYDYGFRIYNPRIAKFLSVDPLTASYPWLTPYQFAENDVIRAIDLEGLEKYFTMSGELLGQFGESTEVRIVYSSQVNAAKSIIAMGLGTPASEVLNERLYNSGSAAVFNSTDEGAIDWGMRNNNKSIKEGREYQSFIFATKIEGCYYISYTEPVPGGVNKVESSFDTKSGAKLLAAIHAHANYIQPSDNQFSNGIPGNPNWGDIPQYDRLGIKGYVSTPNGSLLQYNNATQKTNVLKSDLPSDCNDPSHNDNCGVEQLLPTIELNSPK